MNFKLGPKFAARHLDAFVDDVYRNVEANHRTTYFFDLTEVEHIGNQELLVLSALFKSFVNSKIKFKVLFFNPGTPSADISDRVKRQIIQIWDVWEIWKIVPADECRECFGIDDKYIRALKRELEYYPEKLEIYDRHGVTPFIALDYIERYNESGVQKLIEPIYRLNSVIKHLLEKNRCYHPFTSNSLSTIITEELYLNFLDHSTAPGFANFPQMAFMSISFHPKMRKAPNEIQRMKELNFKTEDLKETKNFFYDRKNKHKNQPYIEFSFLDFGKGIVNTLKDQFLSEAGAQKSKSLDSDVLRYAFNHNSSRHPIFDKNNEVDNFIPRGLFDALTIVKRYKGLLIARSNFGKILFDFSDCNDVKKAYKAFPNKNLFFPGTLITLYIPAIEKTAVVDISSIKPEVEFNKVKPENKKYLNISTVVERLNGSKEQLYNSVLQKLRTELYDREAHSLVYVSFKGCEYIDKRIIRKIIYFLLSDYDVNHCNNVVVFNSPPGNIIEEIASEILHLNVAIRNYKLHPLPIIDLDNNGHDLNITWLGVYNPTDKKELNNLLYEDYVIAQSDLIEPDNVIGHLNSFDSYGNLISNFPNKKNIIGLFRFENETIITKQVEALLRKHECIKADNATSLYLCAGNYYQREFIELNDLVSDKTDCNLVSGLLYDKLQFTIGALKNYHFIGVTTASHKILQSLAEQKLISEKDYIHFDSLDNFDRERINSSKKYILICDVISSGYLTQKLHERLLELGTGVDFVAVISSILDPSLETTKTFLVDNAFESKIICLHKHAIKKLKLGDIKDEIATKDIIRINPYTNIPVRLSIEQTNFNESIIFPSNIIVDENNSIIIRNKFLDSIKQNDVHIGFFRFNNLIHPYFFVTETILKQFHRELLKDIFRTINNKGLKKNRIQAFYPTKSNIGDLNFDDLKAVIENHDVEQIEIERFETIKGWRFPHNADYLTSKIKSSFCLILDDGSCTGDSLIQMIDEISFYAPKEIIVLCFVGRVDDHKREFFSRISSIKARKGAAIPISIYFASHWHLPTYYLDDNPNTKEIVWLNNIIELKNTPRGISSIARNILQEITPRMSLKKDHKYLPKTRSTNQIPKKEILSVREELGKVVGYRLYKESFVFFDNFFRKYQKVTRSKDRYKEIELLCAVFVYEPYLYNRMAQLLPDIAETIERFIRVLLFSDDHKIYKLLTYNWRQIDILHLFFIVFRDEKLVNELDSDKFNKLIEFTQPKESALNYVLYKLLSYFPLKETEIEDKVYDVPIRELIKNLKVGSNQNTEIRKFYSFVSTLPSRVDFKAQLGILNDNYNKQMDRDFHDDKISFAHNISLILAKIREFLNKLEEKKSLDKDHIETTRERWFELTTFLNPILEFSSSYTEFLLPFPYYRLIKKINFSLRDMVGFNEDVIFSLNESFNDIPKLKLLEENILRIQSDFKINSDFHKLVSTPQSQLKELLDNLLKEIKISHPHVVSRGFNLLDTKYMTNIPQLYAERLILKELITNVNIHSRKGKKSRIVINCSKPEKNTVQVEIINTRSLDHPVSGNGEGVKCLTLLSDSQLFGFRFKHRTVGKDFVQNLTFEVQ